MKKMGLFVLLISICFIVGCAMPYSPGAFYSKIDTPIEASGMEIGSKTGTSTMVNYAGAVAMGDASIIAAAKSAGITKIKTIDVHYDSIMGIINTTTTTITGD
ncbi:MAG: hypothetical protein PF482_20330 [Desulfobacteraceae bacterium]|jgi:hypothetical protein|nr:hypothetical protein [Desulfobacteraceae bacterium]